MKIGEKIRKVRELKGFSQDFMATQLEISQKSYSRIENENTKIDFNKINEISKLLEIDPIKLLTFDENQVFNNYEQKGGNAANVVIQAYNEKEKQLYEDRIKHLEEEIKFLRDSVNSK